VDEGGYLYPMDQKRKEVEKIGGNESAIEAKTIQEKLHILARNIIDDQVTLL
jgi:hypothetical protein